MRVIHQSLSALLKVHVFHVEHFPSNSPHDEASDFSERPG